MPRKDFRRDLDQAGSPGWFPRLSKVKPGEDDGSICFTYTTGSLPLITIDFQALVSDLSEYPDNHEYFIFSTSDDVPSVVASTIEDVQPLVTGSSVKHFLSTISDVVDNALSSNQNPDEDEFDERGDVLSDDETNWGISLDHSCHFGEDEDEELLNPTCSEVELKTTFRLDLCAAKTAGFKVGYLGEITGSVIVSVSCRIAKLGISEEAMQAWNVCPSQYLVLLIRYPRTYLDLEQILHDESIANRSFVRMQVGLCDSYKPTLTSAIQAFMRLTGSKQNQGDPLTKTGEYGKLTPLFIDRPLQTLLNERLVKIVSCRYKYGFSWAGAELYFNNNEGRILNVEDTGKEEYFASEDWGTYAPRFLATDHMSDTSPRNRLSFPLLAMQFTLRHFVRCTEFCLVCHCKTNAGFEALKPYVCSKPLCLYQFMELGMGPSLEWEIISQPYVVDLLISFTYTSAAYGRLNDFPTGLGFQVPRDPGSLRKSLIHVANDDGLRLGTDSYTAKIDKHRMELLVSGTSTGLFLRPGDWITILPRKVPGTFQSHGAWHCRVKSTNDWPVVQISNPVTSQASSTQDLDQQDHNVMDSVTFVVYDTNFDDLDNGTKRQALMMLIETLPGIDAMRSFLDNDPNDSERLLFSWKDRISRSALDVLRWIVASNRSCIMQDGTLNPASDSAINHNLVSGMEGYMQFRLAQGAPDKEQRFIESVNSTASRLQLTYPTLFAWHGSSLANWHSILREGLHFKETLHGRAFGDGVYMSPWFTTSSSYCNVIGNPITTSTTWPNSRLNITSAISLNEVVNAPKEFQSSNPHFVVTQLDWIQPRYLFVHCRSPVNTEEFFPKITPKAPSIMYKQDPKHLAYGPKAKAINIPITAISSRRREAMQTTIEKPKPSKSRKRKPKAEATAENDDTESVETNNEDLLLFLSDAENEDEVVEGTTSSIKVKAKVLKMFGKKSSKQSAAATSASQTDFQPGTLTESSLKLLAPPEYATSSATRMLQQHLQATLKIQDTQPLHELGWYIDPNLINTVYQWIVELHSFEPHLPLAQDLKAADLKSVVLEIRFTQQFPISPPFVRVIRPRFLEFQYGGGGHVTAGGALCMELLTNSGWSPVSSIESVLLQVRLAMSSMDPKPARLYPGQSEKNGVKEYSVDEAIVAYKRACIAHGWEIPKDFKQMTWE